MEMYVLHEDDAAPMYRGGITARMARMPIPAPHVWEQCYDVISPAELESDQRLYSSGDVRRFALPHALVSQGRAIGVVAHVDNTEFQQLLEASVATGMAAPAPSTAAVSMAVRGALLVKRVRRGKSALALLGIEAVIKLPVLGGEILLDPPPHSGALVVEAASPRPETAEAMLAAVRRCGASAVGVIYSFGTVCATDMLCATGVWLY